jgi:hypothetical protein
MLTRWIKGRNEGEAVPPAVPEGPLDPEACGFARLRMGDARFGHIARGVSVLRAPGTSAFARMSR